MAVLVGLGDDLGTNVAAGSGLVLDDHRLTDGVLQLGADEPRQDVRSAARSKRHDDPHRFGERLSLRRPETENQDSDPKGERSPRRSVAHCNSSLSLCFAGTMAQEG